MQSGAILSNPVSVWAGSTRSFVNSAWIWSNVPGDGGNSGNSLVSAVMMMVEEDDGCRTDVNVDVDSLPCAGARHPVSTAPAQSLWSLRLERCLCTVRLGASA